MRRRLLVLAAAGAASLAGPASLALAAAGSASHAMRSGARPAVRRPVRLLQAPAVPLHRPAPPGQGAPPNQAASPQARPASVLGTILSPITGTAGALASAALAAIGSWVLQGARGALLETAGIISRATAPRLTSTWFSSTYWRVAALAALLTLPFLFAAAIQALLRSDLPLLLRAAFGYLPLAWIGVSLAAPIIMLLLAATDEMSGFVAGAGVGGGAHFLSQTAVAATGVSALQGSPFLAFVVGLVLVAAALALALELLVREAAVYIVVLMLPLAFAAMVWPARRIWAVRLVELLLALILSKFVIVAVLSLAGAAFGSSGGTSATRLLTAMALVMLATFAPWAMLRLLPFAEVAAGAGGALRAEVPRAGRMARTPMAWGETAAGVAERLPAMMARQAREAFTRTGGGTDDSAVMAGESVSGPMGRLATGEAGGDGQPGGSAFALTGGAGDGRADGSGDSPSPAPQPPPRRERLPGLDAPYQAEDGAWPPMHLGSGPWEGPSTYAPADPPLGGDPDPSWPHPADPPDGADHEDPR